MYCKKSLLVLLGLAGMMLTATPASAALVFEGVVDLTGTGLGAVDTVLTIQETGRGSDGVESGAVGWNGTADVASGPDVKTGGSQTQTILALGPVDALRVVFNPNEPGEADGQSIRLDDLMLTLFSSSGSVLFTSGVFAPTNFADAGQGTGTSGFSFLLDALQTATLNLALSATGAGARYGLSAQASLASGGPETFFITQDVSAVPLPAALPLLAGGLGGLGVLSWWRKRKDKRQSLAA